MAEKTGRVSGRRELEELIQTCVSIENRQFNPFLLDISEALRIIRRHAGSWKTLGDNLLDMRAITSLARVVGLQSANLRFQSSSLFVDPGMVKQKVESMSREQLAGFLLLSWHPVVELEQLTEASTKEALDYWQRMLSFFERRKRLQPGPFDSPGAMDTPELARMSRRSGASSTASSASRFPGSSSTIRMFSVSSSAIFVVPPRSRPVLTV